MCVFLSHWSPGQKFANLLRCNKWQNTDFKCVIYINAAQAGKGYFISVKKCCNLYRTVNKYVALLRYLLQEQNKLRIFCVKKLPHILWLCKVFCLFPVWPERALKTKEHGDGWIISCLLGLYIYNVSWQISKCKYGQITNALQTPDTRLHET